MQNTFNNTSLNSYFFLDFLWLCFFCSFVSLLYLFNKVDVSNLELVQPFAILIKNLSPPWFCGSVSAQGYLSRNYLLLEFLWIDLHISIRKLWVCQGSHSLLFGLRYAPKHCHSKIVFELSFLSNYNWKSQKQMPQTISSHFWET